MVDDHPAEILPTNYLLRGAVIDAGVHRLTFSYRPRSLLVAAGVSTAGLIALCRLGFVAFRERKTRARVPLAAAITVERASRVNVAATAAMTATARVLSVRRSRLKIASLCGSR